MGRLSNCDFALAFGLEPAEQLRGSADTHRRVSSRSKRTLLNYQPNSRMHEYVNAANIINMLFIDTLTVKNIINMQYQSDIQS